MEGDLCRPLFPHRYQSGQRFPVPVLLSCPFPGSPGLQPLLVATCFHIPAGPGGPSTEEQNHGLLVTVWRGAIHPEAAGTQERSSPLQTGYD